MVSSITLPPPYNSFCDSNVLPNPFLASFIDDFFKILLQRFARRAHDNYSSQALYSISVVCIASKQRINDCFLFVIDSLIKRSTDGMQMACRKDYPCISCISWRYVSRLTFAVCELLSDFVSWMMY